MTDYRCETPAEVQALLLELRDTAGPTVLSGPDGAALSASLWTVDPAMQRISFDVEGGHPALEPLVGGNECTAVAYLRSVKLQFDLDDLMLVRGRRGTALQARLPALLYRFQRREAFRVRSLDRPCAVVELRHPAMPEMLLALRVLDISTSGCALQVPPDVPPLPLDIVVDGAQLALDLGTRLPVSLHLLHASSLGQQADGLRLGCALVAPEPDTVRLLQRHVDQLQRKRRLLALD